MFQEKEEIISYTLKNKNMFWKLLLSSIDFQNPLSIFISIALRLMEK